jgi:hypothetical protein
MFHELFIAAVLHHKFRRIGDQVAVRRLPLQRAQTFTEKLVPTAESTRRPSPLKIGDIRVRQFPIVAQSLGWSWNLGHLLNFVLFTHVMQIPSLEEISSKLPKRNVFCCVAYRHIGIVAVADLKSMGDYGI